MNIQLYLLLQKCQNGGHKYRDSGNFEVLFQITRWSLVFNFDMLKHKVEELHKEKLIRAPLDSYAGILLANQQKLTSIISVQRLYAL